MSDRSELKVDVVEVMARALFAKEWKFAPPKDGMREFERQYWTESARAALAALEENGFVLVPRESTSAVEALRALSDEGRMEVMAHFCKHCGSDNPGCQCWNDE